MSKHLNVPNISFPSDLGLHQLLSREVERSPDRVALVFQDKAMTYKELDARADKLAAYLIHLGLQKENFVALYLERSFEMIIGIFGILKAGGAYVPIDVDYPKERMAFMVQDAGAKVILTQKHLKNNLPETAAKVLCLDEPLKKKPCSSISTQKFEPSNLAYMIYTSGSTGKPKGVMISHENVCNQLQGQQAIAPEPIGTMMLTCSVSFDVSVLTFFWTLLQGATLVLPEQGEERDMSKLTDTIFKNKVTHILTLPSLYTLLLEQGAPEKLQSLELVNVSGEVCPVSLAQKHEQIIPNGQLYNLYGPTEATVNCTYFTFPKGFNAEKTPIGKPILNYEILILDKNQKEVPRGQVGEIYIGGTKPVVGRGYWNRPELTDERFSPLPASSLPPPPSKGGGDVTSPPPLGEVGRGLLYKTGDLARWMPDGNIEFLGRTDFQVKYRGFRIELGEVETAISNHPVIKETVVVLRNQHEVNNQQLVAYLTANQGFSVTISELRDFLTGTLPEYMLPSHFVFLEKMPLTTNGKFDRNALPAPTNERPVLSEIFEGPLSGSEQKIAEKWESILGITPIGRNDKFFELGGTSIQAAKFIGEMMTELKTSIFITSIFDFPTVATYARFIEKNYPNFITDLFDNSVKLESHEQDGSEKGSLLVLSKKQITDFPNYIPSHLTQNQKPRTKNPDFRPIFILAPPRSGTTLLRVMLAGHPGLFACNELQLLHFETLVERGDAYSGKFKLWTEGLIRAVMELKDCSAEEANSTLQGFEEKGISTTDVFLKLQNWIGDRSLVDKSPSYLLDPLALEKAIQDFPNARFIHLVRHPYSMVKSFEKYHMDQVLYLEKHNYNARELGELVWLWSHRNAVEFLDKIPTRQQCRIVYEDLVKEPEKTMQRMCYQLGIPFHENLLDPYRDLDKKMTDGLYSDSRSMGDTNFDKKKRIDPKKAEDWKGVLNNNFLCNETWKVAEEFGFERVGHQSSINNQQSTIRSQQSTTNNQQSNIAIIGMSCRFPGAKNIEEFWQNLIHAKDVSRTVTEEDLQAEGVAVPDNYVWKTYSLDNPYCFDASFFGYHPKEAELTDPQHRVFLETAYQALETAGYNPYNFDGKIGVFGGVARNTYFTNNITSNPELLKEAGGYQEMLATESSFSISRVAYKLNLRGPAVNVQTACSTGGVAVHLACQSLLSGDSDMVIVGGGRIQSPVNGGYEYVEGGPLSPDGSCRAFDADANGMVQGNGMGMLVLKKLDKAVEDGDHIWSVIKSSAINNDGSDKSGITAPSHKGQSDCIADAIEKAGLLGSQIGYFETHGTGTFIGDPIEIQGLTNAVSHTAVSGKIPIGSVKTNIGHLDAGACIAGIIKTALSLHHEMLPPTMHFKKPNPQIGFDKTAFYVNDKLQPWLTGNEPRRAGVSSFGLGGTNAHIILEEAPGSVGTGQRTVGSPQLMLVSAKTDMALESAGEQLRDFIKNNPETNLSHAAQTLATGRPHFAKRKALVFDGENKFISIPTPKNQPPRTNPHFIFMFPGGGAQYENMARDLYESNIFFKKQLERCFEILIQNHDLDIKDKMFPKATDGKTQSSVTSDLERPTYALASLFTIEYSLAKLWQHWGIRPAEMIGHSMGEYAAACLSGVMSLEAALGLVAVRGKLFETLEGDGCMLSIATTERQLEPVLDVEHTISVINKEDSLVVSSTRAGIERLQNKLNALGIENTKIHISVPAHSPLIEPILNDFREYLQSVDLQEPTIPFVSNVTGTWIKPTEATDPEYWIRHIRQKVRFADGLNTLINVEDQSLTSSNSPFTIHHSPLKKNRIFLEVGPGQTLSTFARAFPTLNGEKRLVLASVRHPKEVTNDATFIYKSVGKLWVNGVDVQWDNFYENQNFKSIPLPTYPFEKKKYFVKPRFEITVPQPNEPPSALPLKTPLLLENTPNPTMKSITRIPILISEIKQSLHELSGMEPADMDAEATFLELGFDSLFLSQAVIKFNYKFKLKLSFRMLFEEASTIAALAEYVDNEIPEDMFVPEPITSPAPAIGISGTPLTDSLSTNSQRQENVAQPGNDQLENLIQQQLSIMQQQLNLLRGEVIQNTQSPLHPLSKKVVSSPVNTSNADRANGTAGQKEVEIERKTKGVTAKMGNYKKIGSDNELTKQQQKGLRDFIERYNELTKGSKDLAQRHRQFYADPRSVTGFSKLWKEICYQIAHEKSKGSKIWDVDGNEYIDYVMSYGVALFGHMPDFVEKAVTAAIQRGNSIDLLPPEATEIARIICKITGYDRVTLANTGTEAVLGAVRTARTATGKDRIAVFDTDYHGMIDQFMVRGINLNGKNKTLPGSPGIPNFLVENTLTLDYDDPAVLQKLENEISDLAAVVIEPVQAQNPHWQHKELIQKIRQLTEKHDVALIFDEIINGFRMHQRGAQGWYGVDADISAYGKGISGGFPIAAIAGKAKYMDAFDGGVWNYGDESSPDGVITYFASTFIKNPISVAAGHAALIEIERLGPALQEGLNEKTLQFAKRIKEIFLQTKAPLMIQCVSSFFMIKNADGSPLTRLFHYFLRARGVNVRERPCFISTAHTAEDFEKTYKAFELAIQDMFEANLLQPWIGEDLNVIVETADGGRQTADEFQEPKTKNPASPAGRQEPRTKNQIPLTEGQQEIYLSSQFTPEASKAYNIATEIKLEGAFDVERMKAALQALVNRHEALRTVMNEDGMTQTVLGEMQIEIPVIDLSTKALSSGGSSLQQLYIEEAEYLFNLIKGPLVRFKIVKLGDEKHLVFINVHHIICDGWSLGILTRELGEMYGSNATNIPSLQNLESLSDSKQLGEYAIEQADLQQLDVYKDNEKYWLEQFSDGVPVLNLPTDFHRPPVRTFPGAVEKISFEPAFTVRLKKTAATNGSTFYVFMLAAYQAYLSRITGQDDFVVGIAAAGHNMQGNQNLVAHAIGLLPVRTKLERAATFKDYLKTVRGNVLDAFDHQQFTFGSLVKQLKLERFVNRNAVVNVAFNLDSPLDDLAYGKLQASTKAIPRHYETFDSFINLKPVGEGFDFEWNFNTDLFKKESIQLRLQEFKNFLQDILEDAGKPITGLRLLPDFESQQLYSFGQGDKVDFPLHQCLHELFEEQAERTPDNIAVQMTDGSQLTYHQLNEKANTLAGVLIEKGLESGTFVGLCVERSLDTLVSIYAILKAGGAYVPIDPRNPKERIRFTLEDAGCQILVTQKILVGSLPNFDGVVVFPTETLKQNKQPLKTHHSKLITQNSPAYVIYTSGSTGRPKGVVVRHENAVNTLFAINRLLKMSEGDTVYSVSSMSFDMSIPDYFLTLMTGATLILADETTKKDGFALRDSLEKVQPTFMQATPTTWKILMLSGWQGDPGLTAIAGGEGFPKLLAAQMVECCKSVWNGYGPTETTIYATYQKVTPKHLQSCPGEFVAIGSPIANTEMYVLDKNGLQVPIGIPGELYIGGSGISDGYLNRPKLNKERFSPLPTSPKGGGVAATSPPLLEGVGGRLYKTGDLVRYLSTGEIEFLGRIDNQVKIRGYRIELGEIEEVILQNQQVDQAVVNIFEDKTGNPQLAAYVVGQNSVAQGLKSFLKTRLPGYMIPAFFVEMEELPMSTSLKVDRKALPKPDTSILQTEKIELPVTKGEVLLTDIWKDLLGVKEVSVKDDFFELGGHSLAAVQLMSRIKEATGKKLPLTTLFQHSTIQTLAGQLNGFNKPIKNGISRKGEREGPFTSLICIRKGGDKTPLYLVHGGGLHVLFYQNLAKYLDEDQPIYALQAVGLNEGEESLDNIEDMAAHYIREIKIQNPGGPYCLAGYSLGGLIAWEMASQLKAENKDVPLLALFDAVAKYEWAGNGRNSDLKKKFKKLGFNLSLMMKDPAGTLGYKSSVLKMQFQHMKGKLTMAYRNNQTDKIEEGFIPYGKEVYEKSLEAYDKYELKPLDIHVDLFKAKEQMFYLHDPENYGWDQFAHDGLTIHLIEGNHLTLFDDPHGKEVAEALKGRLKEVMSF